MAIKGCARRMVVLNGVGGNLFETAYFIVRTEAEEVSRIDMLREANRIVEENCFSTAGVKKWRRAAIFALGVAAGAAAVGALWLILTLL